MSRLGTICFGHVDSLSVDLQEPGQQQVEEYAIAYRTGDRTEENVDIIVVMVHIREARCMKEDACHYCSILRKNTVIGIMSFRFFS